MQTFNNLDETDQLLRKYKLPQCTQYEVDNSNSPITIKKIKYKILQKIKKNL